MRLPKGYASVCSGTWRGFARPRTATWLESVLTEGLTVHEWAAERGGTRLPTGRGTVYGVPAPVTESHGHPAWAVRHYRRGGRMAPLLVDRYVRVGAPRPVREVAASAEARARGIPTPAVVAGVVYPEGPFYRADLVTELIPDAATLAEWLFDERACGDPCAALRAAGRLVRSLEDAGVVHADLNAHNVVYRMHVVGEPDAYVIDLDRCRILARCRRPRRSGMRRRLERSLKKLARQQAREISSVEWEALATGVEESP